MITSAQLLAIGVGKAAIQHRVRSGRLYPIHRGVYAVGHPVLTDHGVWLTAVLALGDSAVLSHRPAGILTGFLPVSRSDRRPPTDITVPRRLKARDAITPHTARNLRPSDVTKRHGIPVTTAARTLLDLSAALHAEALERAMNEALVQRFVNHRQLQDQCDHAVGIPTTAFATALANATPTRSGLEDHVLREMRKRGHLRPQTNVRVAGFEVDVFYPDRGLVIEIDGARYHQTPAAKRRDARKQAALEAAGLRVVHIPQDAIDEALDQLEEDHLRRV